MESALWWLTKCSFKKTTQITKAQQASVCLRLFGATPLDVPVTNTNIESKRAAFPNDFGYDPELEVPTMEP
jgi:hypothetical protein